MRADALISPCGFFRYTLTRVWDDALPRLLFIMLNPSTADALLDDATIRRCIGFARGFGFGGIEVVNLFAFRTKSPAVLMKHCYPVGPDNDEHIIAALGRAGGIICAWGSAAKGHPRVREVLDIVGMFGASPPMALRLSEDGTPWHPLYLPSDSKPVPLGA